MIMRTKAATKPDNLFQPRDGINIRYFSSCSIFTLQQARDETKSGHTWKEQNLKIQEGASPTHITSEKTSLP